MRLLCESGIRNADEEQHVLCVEKTPQRESFASEETRGEVSALIVQWIEKSNVKDIPSLLKLTQTDIEIFGPKGSVIGSQHLAEWLERARLHLEHLLVLLSGIILFLNNIV